MKSYLKIIFVMFFSSIMFGFFITHYFENHQLPYARKIRELIYFDDSEKKFDKNGIRVIQYKHMDKNLYFYNPVSIALQCLDDAQCVIGANLEHPPNFSNKCESVNKDKILKIARWFAANGERRQYENYYAVMYPYEFPLPIYNLEPPWYSGLAQGYASEVLLAAYFLTNDTRYKELSIESANGLKIPLNHGGTSFQIGENVWFVEYASPNYENPPPLVLNGHIFAMDAIYWLKQIDPESWELLYHKALFAVEQNIEKYYSKFWSYYDLRNNMASGKYHAIHIFQLQRLAKISKSIKIDQVVADFYCRKVMPIGIFERLFRQKNNMVIFLLSINSFIALSVHVFIYAIFIKIYKNSKIYHHQKKL